MYTLFLAGGIASGKSTVAQALEDLGAWRIDLDQVSRDVLAPGSDLLPQIAEAFGRDLLDSETGELDRRLLAQRAFASPEETARLEALEMPAIRRRLADLLAVRGEPGAGPACCVVEIPLLDRVVDMVDLADEVACVTCPMDLRRQRAVGRGMEVADFERRLASQPTDAWLRSHATHEFVNGGTREALVDQVKAWWRDRIVFDGAGGGSPRQHHQN